MRYLCNTHTHTLEAAQQQEDRKIRVSSLEFRNYNFENANIFQKNFIQHKYVIIKLKQNTKK